MCNTRHLLLFRRHSYHTPLKDKVYLLRQCASKHNPSNMDPDSLHSRSSLKARLGSHPENVAVYQIWPVMPWISLLSSLKENTDLCLLLFPDWVWTPSCWQRSSTCPQVVAGPATRTIQFPVSWRESPQPTTTRVVLEPHWWPRYDLWLFLRIVTNNSFHFWLISIFF